MKVLDLFSGIGGFSLGLERAGMETVAFCEFDKKAQLVLKKHWPDVPIYDDVRKLNGRQFEGQSIELICGGFPCQPFSQAGKRKGKEDDRHLWPEYFRLIQEIRPRWVCGENVSGLISLGLDQVLSDLESEDYSCQTLIIPACAVNAPHRRDRVWILAHAPSRNNNNPAIRETQSDDGCKGIRPEDVANTGCTLQPWTIKQETHENETGQGDANKHQRPGSPPGFDVAYPVSSSEGTAHRSRASRIADKKQNNGNQFRNDSGNSGETLAHTKGGNRDGHENVPRDESPETQEIFGNGSGPGRFDSWWAVEPNVGRVAHGVPNRVDRLKQLGNAVIPQIPELIGRAIMAVEAQPCK